MGIYVGTLSLFLAAYIVYVIHTEYVLPSCLLYQNNRSPFPALARRSHLLGMNQDILVSPACGPGPLLPSCMSVSALCSRLFSWRIPRTSSRISSKLDSSEAVAAAAGAVTVTVPSCTYASEGGTRFCLRRSRTSCKISCRSTSAEALFVDSSTDDVVDREACSFKDGTGASVSEVKFLSFWVMRTLELDAVPLRRSRIGSPLFGKRAEPGDGGPGSAELQLATARKKTAVEYDGMDSRK